MLAGASGAELGELLAELDAVASSASAARVSVAVEAVRRGEVAGSGVHGWVREHAPSLRQGGAGPVSRVAIEVATAGSRSDDGKGPAEGSPLGIVWDAVREGRVEAGTGCLVLRESARLAPLLRPETVPTVTSALVDLVTAWGPTLMRRLRPRLLADHGHHGALDDLQQRLAGAARLSMPHVESADLTEYQLWMTPEQAATLEAAIGPLSAPQPNDETGEADLRPAGQRRVEALTQVCAVASGTESLEDAGSPATLHVTIPLSDMQASTGAGEILGSVATGTLLAPETLRRLACDAAVVLHGLGAAGEPLTLGRLERLFTRPQRRHLWLRDRGCTYPGCSAPAAWARAHHVRHWSDGGPTDVSNAALLCQRHHTTVHRRRLRAQVRRRPDEHGRYVVWDLTDGSYDRASDTAPPGGDAVPTPETAAPAVA
ncbi:HNH endonuclease signature motif containing protein [Phycicoccus sonneratiae]|uniref:DUF222 domain-containing protein n=1 Tax=Phycicoccus sonneratiae TaxID=2807628 RepID=A0ABS2CH52_9MICO|nr:HNH endonuclease signature motif containing protein [Phycicoccus sonneraticus]MBM6399196.1 DUF222 domain-containing protein [Phycicoccus sonneraticus]